MARFTNGWVKVYRSIGEGDLVDNPILLALWIRLLTLATWRSTKILYAGKQRELPPGTVVFGVKEIADTWAVSRSVIQKWLRYLHDTGRIVLTANQRGTIVSICNWESYQSAEINDAVESVNSEATACSLRVNSEALIEEGKKVRKKEGKGKAELHPLAVIWNEKCGNLPKVSGCSSTRMKGVQARWSEQNDPSYWERVVSILAASEFCNGKNDRKWRADFDFLIQPDTQHKAIEGKYGNASASGVSDAQRAEREAYQRELEAYSKGTVA